MTTIAYKDGVMAGDSQIGNENRRVGHRTKILRIGQSLFGFAGDVAAAEAAAAWFKLQHTQRRPWWRRPHTVRRPHFDPDVTLTVLEASSAGVTLYSKGLFPEPIRGAQFAIGSGADFALGAMAAGATATEAVEVAIRLDVYSGGPVEALSLSPSGPESGVRQ